MIAQPCTHNEHQARCHLKTTGIRTAAVHPWVMIVLVLSAPFQGSDSESSMQLRYLSGSLPYKTAALWQRYWVTRRLLQIPSTLDTLPCCWQPPCIERSRAPAAEQEARQVDLVPKQQHLTFLPIRLVLLSWTLHQHSWYIAFRQAGIVPKHPSSLSTRLAYLDYRSGSLYIGIWH